MHPVVRAILQAGEQFIRYGKAYFDGTGDYLSLADSADFEYGSSAFCIEHIFTPSATSFGIWSKHAAGVYDEYYMHFTSNKVKFYATTNGTSWNITLESGALSAGTKYHVAIVRNGDVYTLYINGTSVATTTVTGSIRTASNAFWIGRESSDYYYGYFYGIRITKLARYTGSFSPPDYFTVDSADVKLCMNFAEAIGATTFIDETGKTVTTYGNTIIVA